MRISVWNPCICFYGGTRSRVRISRMMNFTRSTFLTFEATGFAVQIKVTRESQTAQIRNWKGDARPARLRDYFPPLTEHCHLLLGLIVVAAGSAWDCCPTWTGAAWWRPPGRTSAGVSGSITLVNNKLNLFSELGMHATTLARQLVQVLRPHNCWLLLYIMSIYLLWLLHLDTETIN